MSKSGWWQPLLFRLAVTFSDLRLGVITWCSWHHLILVTSLLSARLLQCEWVGRWVAPRTEENNVVKVSDILCPELTVSGQSVPTQGGRPQRPLVIWNVNYRDNTDLRGQHFLNVARFQSINRWFLLNMKDGRVFRVCCCATLAVRLIFYRTEAFWLQLECQLFQSFSHRARPRHSHDLTHDRMGSK